MKQKKKRTTSERAGQSKSVFALSSQVGGGKKRGERVGVNTLCKAAGVEAPSLDSHLKPRHRVALQSTKSTPINLLRARVLNRGFTERAFGLRVPGFTHEMRARPTLYGRGAVPRRAPVKSTCVHS